MDTFNTELTTEYQLADREIQEHFTEEKKQELIAIARQKVAQLHQEMEDLVKDKRDSAHAIKEQLVIDLSEPKILNSLGAIENLQALIGEAKKGTKEALKILAFALTEQSSNQKLQEDSKRAFDARVEFEQAKDQADQIKKDRLTQLETPLPTNTVEQIDQDIVRSLEQKLLQNPSLSQDEIRVVAQEAIASQILAGDKDLNRPLKARVEALSANLAELDYPQKMRMIEDLQENLLGAETTVDLEKYNIELKAQVSTLMEALEPVLFQLRQVFSPDTLTETEQINKNDQSNSGAQVGEKLEEPYKTLQQQALQLEKFAKKVKHLPENTEASYRTRKAIFEAVARTTSFDDLRTILEINQEFITRMRLDYEHVGKTYGNNFQREIVSIVSSLRLDEKVEFDFSKFPTFLTEKIKELILKFQEEERGRKTEQYTVVVNAAKSTLELQIWLRDLGKFIPEGSSVDAEELSIDIEAFWLKVSFSEPDEEVEKLIPPELNIPPLNTKLTELLKLHPAYVELKKIKAGEYGHTIDGLIGALKKIGSAYTLSDTGGITAGRMALILSTLRSNWETNVNVPRNVAGVNLGKRRLHKEEIKDKMTQGSLRFLDEEKNQFILTAIVEALDTEGRN